MIKDHFRLAVGQLNPVMGDISGNLALAVKAYKEAKNKKADILLLTELFISGYPPEDLVLKPAFTTACEKAIKELAKITLSDGPALLVGTPLRRDNDIYNAVVLLADGKVLEEHYKHDLPNYGEFDEKRVFQAGPRSTVISFRGLKFAAPICEDIWNDLTLCSALYADGAEIILVPNGSPYSHHKLSKRVEVVRAQVKASGIPIIYANQVGGQDELVFDGASFAVSSDGAIAFQMKQFSEDISITDWHKKDGNWHCENGRFSETFDGIAADYQACMLGFGDYVNKNGFKSVVLGMSGGIDSALCAAIAVDALGPERVRTIMLPFRYTSQESFNDAEECTRLLGCSYETVPIFEPVEGFLKALEPIFSGTDSGITEENLQSRAPGTDSGITEENLQSRAPGTDSGITGENLQSRARGTILMALSNKFGSMVVTTGNKSELAVGYTTLYGDMNGGFNPIKDLYKMQVYAASKWRNEKYPAGSLGREGIVIAQNIIDKAPSAELRENQLDQDSLPPYEVLDDILECLIENDMSMSEIIARGHDYKTVERVENLLYIAEYKRRQSAPGVKITQKNLGRDRRYPITNRFRDKE